MRILLCAAIVAAGLAGVGDALADPRGIWETEGGKRLTAPTGQNDQLSALLDDHRHTHASHAVMNGVPVPVVSRMLGHSNVRMTLRYAHLGDRDIEAAAERIGRSVARIMDI